MKTARHRALVLALFAAGCGPTMQSGDASSDATSDAATRPDAIGADATPSDAIDATTVVDAPVEQDAEPVTDAPAAEDTLALDAPVTPPDVVLDAPSPADAMIPPSARPPALCDVPAEGRLVDTSTPRTVVGTGTPASCTEAMLRAAVTGGGIVTFNCGSAPATITLTSELLVRNAAPDLVIDGGGSVTLSGGGRTRILKIDACESPVSPRCDTDPRPRVTLQRLGFRDGYSRDTTARTKETRSGGGAIFRRGGTLTVIDSDFADNSCDELGQDVSGGAITSQHTQVTLVVGSTFRGNRCANGGALGSLQAAVRVFNSVFERNAATGSGGNHVPTAASRAMGDTGGNGGSGGAIVVDGQNMTVELCGLAIRENSAHAHGSALFRTGYTGERFSMRRSSLERNVLDGLAYPSTMPDLHNPASGTIYLQGVRATIEQSSLTENRSNGGTPGIFTAPMGATNSVIDLTNVTIAGNQLSGTGIGGALQASNAGASGTWTNVTVADNGANFGGGIIFSAGFTLRNTLIANNRRDDADMTGMYNPRNCFCPGCALMAGGPNVQWPQTNSSGRRDEPACAPGITFADPRLGSLGDVMYGRALVPMAGSSVIGAGRECPAVDQRGRARTASSCAIGAIEP